MYLHEAGQGLSVFLKMLPRLTFGTWRMALTATLLMTLGAGLTRCRPSAQGLCTMFTLHVVPLLGLHSLPSAARALDLYRILDI